MRRLAVIAACFAVLASCAGESEPTPLPIAGSTLGNRADINDEWRTIAYRFELPSDLAITATHAPAYKLTTTITAADAERTARALGVRGPLTDEGGNWSGGVFDGSGLGFSMGADRVFSLAVYSPPVDCDDDFSDASASCVGPTTTTLVAPVLPSARDAEGIARRALDRAALDLSGATVVSSKERDAMRVRFFRTVDGLRAAGYEVLVDVADDRVSGAYGLIGTPTRVGDYELTSLTHAVSRLNALGAAYSEQTTIGLSDVEVGLMVADTEPDVWLVPAYLFTTEDGRLVAAPAAKDKHFEDLGN